MRGGTLNKIILILVVIIFTLLLRGIFRGSKTHDLKKKLSKSPVKNLRSDDSSIQSAKYAKGTKEKGDRVLCFVLTHPSNHKTRVPIIANTWGKRCNVLLFISSSTENANGLPIVAFDIKEGRQTLWGKTKRAFKYAYDHYKDEVDWFLKADDDTFVIVENLRHLVSTKGNPNDPIWFGCRYRPYVKKGYMAGAGYILSKEATRRFAERALGSYEGKMIDCKVFDDTGAEDAEMGKCMQALDVEPGESLDEYGRYKFLPLSPNSAVVPSVIDPNYWYYKNIWYPHKTGKGCCSDTAVLFHYVTANNMLLMDYLIYELRVVGEDPDNLEPPDPKQLAKNMDVNWDKIWFPNKYKEKK